MLVVALLAPLLVVPAHAGQQDRAELSQVQRKLDRIRKVLENAEANATEVAAALEQADRDVAAAQVALAEAERRFRAAQARRKQAALEAARAKLEVDAQQAVIDRRAYATYVNSGASAMLTLVVDADSVADLLDRSKLLDNVAKAANSELQALVDAKVAADAARRRAVAAEEQAAEEEARMRARAAELEAIRAARAAAQEALERKIDSLQARQGALRARSGRLIRKIKAEEAARRRAAERARKARLARLARQRAAASRPTVISSDDDGGYAGRAQHDQLQLPHPERQADLRAGGQDLRRPLDRRLAAVRVGAGQRPPARPGHRRDDLVQPFPRLADRQLGGGQRLGARRQVRDLQRPHLDPEPGLARLPPPLRPLQLQPDPAPRRPRAHLGALARSAPGTGRARADVPPGPVAWGR